MYIFAEIEKELLERIYELTYKYQMLQQEERLGDYGAPTILPDKAYMALSKYEYELGALLDEAHEEMVEVYQEWINRHEPSDSDLLESIAESESEWLSHDASLQDIVDILGEDKAKEIIMDYIPEGAIEESLKDPFDQESEYRDYIKQRTAQEQGVFTFEKDPKYTWETIKEKKPIDQYSFAELAAAYPEEVESTKDDLIEAVYGSHNWSTMLDDRLEDARNEYYEETAFSSVVELKNKFDDEWTDASLSDKIILFHESLTTMHNNGEMAEYLLEGPAIKILDELSSGPKVDKWNEDLKRMLGHYPGTTTQVPKDVMRSPDESYTASIHIIKTLNLLN